MYLDELIQKFVVFEFASINNEGQNVKKYYKMKRLGMGLSVAPAIMNSISYALTESIQKLFPGLQVNGFIDDYVISSHNRKQLNEQIPKIIEYVENLGFTVNKEKSILTAKREIEYLGFIIGDDYIRIPDTKIKELDTRRAAAIQTEKPTDFRSFEGLA